VPSVTDERDRYHIEGEEKKKRMTSFVYFSENEKNEYISLLESSKSFDDVIRVDSLRKLWDFVYAAEGKREEMLSPAFNAMTILISVLNEYSHDPETIKNCTGVLWCFSADLACRRKELHFIIVPKKR
jgi:hypothetical protein